MSKKKKSEFNPEDIVLKDEEKWRPLYPFKSHYARIGGFNYHYLDEGPDDASIANGEEVPVLLMVHGNPTWSFFWRNLVLAFRDRYRVIVVDHIGCGLSEKPAEGEYEFSMEQRISDLTALIKKLNLQNITLIAHDWGGVISMGAAQRSPRRFSKFILMNTAAYLSDICPFRIRLCRSTFPGKFLIQGLNAFCRVASRAATTKGLPPDVRAGFMAPYSNWHDRTAVFQFVHDVPLDEKHRSWKTLKEVQNGLALFRECPISLVWGMQDWCFTPAFLKKFIQFFPEAEVNRIDAAGHYLLEDATDEVISYIGAFLDKYKNAPLNDKTNK